MHLSLQRGSILLLVMATAAALVFSLWLYRRTLPPLPDRSRRILAFLRFGAFALLFLLLFDPLVTFESVLTIRPNVAVLLDHSSSMGIVEEGLLGEGTAASRAAAADQVLHDASFELKKKLERRYDVSLFSFADRVTPWEDEAPLGDATDLARALEESMNAEWERGVDAFVVLTDGIVNAGRDPIEFARALGVPVYPVPVGDPTPSRDVSLQQVLANRVVYVNSKVAVEVIVRGKGFPGKELPVRILDGDRILAEEKITFREKRESQTVDLSFFMDREGVHRYTVEVPLQDEEVVEENNRFLFTMEAVKEKLRLLVVAERPSWDLAFLRRLLERDPNLNIDYFLQEKDGTAGPLGDQGEGEPFPHAFSDLVRYDLVALIGVPAVVSREWGESLDRFVRLRGGSLLFLTFDPLTAMMPNPLAELLPVVPNRGKNRFAAEPFSVKITTEGRRHPILRLHRKEETNLGLWSELPPLSGLNRIGPLRPGATLLAAHPRMQTEGRDVPVLALGTAGKGRVLLANGSGFWNWDFRMWGIGKTNRTYEQLWSNVVRWMVARGGFRNVTVKPENITYNRGEAVVFRGLVMDGSLAPVIDARVEVVVSKPDGSTDRFFLAPNVAERGAYERSLGPYPPGDYRYDATVVRGDHLLGEEGGEFSVSDFSAEFLETERNDALLRALARVSGGRVLSVDELGDWQGDLGLETRTRRIRNEREIWNHPLLFLAILGLFSAEWLVRKRKGLS